MKNAPDFIKLLRSSFGFPSEHMADKFCENVKNMVSDCDERGLTSTVYGDLDEKTALYGLFHCKKRRDGMVSVFYAIHELSVELARPGIRPDIQVI